MDQASKLEPFLLLAKSARGRAAADLVQKVTEEPGIFAFGELVDMPGIKELESTDLAAAYRLLQLFCYGTWAEYQGNTSQLPQLDTRQQQKLKQLTVVSMAGQSKRLPYPELMAQLDIANTRALEDFLISDCFYPGLVRGKLDQRGQCLHVHQAVPRDVRPEALQDIISGLSSWLQASQSVLAGLEGSQVAVREAAEASKQRQAALAERVEAAKKALKAESAKEGDLLEDTGTLDMMELEDRGGTPSVPGRSKRRR